MPELASRIRYLVVGLARSEGIPVRRRSRSATARRRDAWLQGSWRPRVGTRQRASVQATDFAGGTAEWVVAGEDLQQGQRVE